MANIEPFALDLQSSPLRTPIPPPSRTRSMSSSQYNALMQRLERLERLEAQTLHNLNDITSTQRGQTLRTSGQPNTISRPRTATTNNGTDKVKGNPPKSFEPENDDIRIWIMDMDDYFRLRQIHDPLMQATCASSYLTDTVRTRTKRLRLSGNTEPFETWINLKDWLVQNYAKPDPTLEATLEMEKIRMRWNESVQTFINRFETVCADLEWNDAAVCAAFRRKLTNDISEACHMLRPEGWPTTFAEFRSLAQRAENHLSIGKRSREDRPERPSKRVRFGRNDRRQELQERGQNVGGGNAATNPNDTPVNPALKAERRARRERGECLACGEKGHFIAVCPRADSKENKDNLPKNERRST